MSDMSEAEKGSQPGSGTKDDGDHESDHVLVRFDETYGYRADEQYGSTSHLSPATKGF
jgi:hypothetical protein